MRSLRGQKGQPLFFLCPLYDGTSFFDTVIFFDSAPNEPLQLSHLRMCATFIHENSPQLTTNSLPSFFFSYLTTLPNKKEKELEVAMATATCSSRLHAGSGVAPLRESVFPRKVQATHYLCLHYITLHLADAFTPIG